MELKVARENDMGDEATGVKSILSWEGEEERRWREGAEGYNYWF